MTHLTVIVSETSSPIPPVYPRPLIYELEFDHEFARGEGIFGVAYEYREEILRRVAEERYYDLVEKEEPDEDVIQGIADGLELHFAFVGPCELVMDWRDW